MFGFSKKKESKVIPPDDLLLFKELLGLYQRNVTENKRLLDEFMSSEKFNPLYPRGFYVGGGVVLESFAVSGFYVANYCGAMDFNYMGYSEKKERFDKDFEAMKNQKFTTLYRIVDRNNFSLKYTMSEEEITNYIGLIKQE